MTSPKPPRSRALTALAGIDGLRRAWPDRTRGALTFEAWDPHGQLRAGTVSVEGSVNTLPFARDPRLETLQPGCARLVVHRMGRRAVEIYDATEQHGTGKVRKHLRARKAQGIAERTQTLAHAVTASGMRVADILDVGAKHIDTALLEGSPLEAASCHSQGWQELVQSWPAFVRYTCDLPSHTGQDEATVLTTWVTQAHLHGALQRCDEVRELAQRLCVQLCARQGVMVTSHRDLHGGQILWDGESLALLDLDTGARASVELDVANLWAHVELDEVRGNVDTHTTRTRLSLIEDLAGALPVDPTLLATYLAASRLRLACVHSFRPGAEEWMERWLDIVLETT